MFRQESIGIDWSAGRLRLARACRRGRRVECFPIGEAAPGEAGWPALLARANGAGSVVSAQVPAHATVVRFITAPLASRGKALKVLPSLLDVQLPFPLEKCCFEFLDVRETVLGQTEACAVAARVEDLRENLAALSRLGLDPHRLDPEGIALWQQSLRELPVRDREERAVLYLGEDRSVLALGRGGALHGVHGFRAGLEQLRGVGEDQAVARLAARIHQALKVRFEDPDPDQLNVVLAGPGCEDGAVVEGLRAALKLPGATGWSQHDDPSMFLARALATRALIQDAWTCNLRSGPLAHPRQQALQAAGLRRATRAAAAAGLLLCLLNAGWAMKAGSAEARLQEELTAKAQAVTGLARVPRGQELLLARRALEKGAAGGNPVRDWFQHPVSMSLAEALGVLHASRATVTELSLEARALTISGMAASWDEPDLWAGKLKAAGWSVTATRGTVTDDGRVPFTLKGAR